MARLSKHRHTVSGGRTAVAPATRGQQSIWTDIENLGFDTSFYSSDVAVRVPAGVGGDAVCEAVMTLARRHDSLRTLFGRDDAGKLIQTVQSTGTLVVDVCDVEGEAESDPYDAFSRCLTEALGYRFDHHVDWPVRVLLASVDGAPHTVVLVLSQLAADYRSQRILERELTELLTTPETQLPPPATQPVELAALEESAAGRRALIRSEQYWRKRLEALPAFGFPEASTPPAQPRYPTVWLRSKAIVLAADVLCARHGGSSSSILLAATALVLGRATRTPRVPLTLIAGNRTGAGLDRYVGTLVQDVPAVVDITGSTFATVARDAWKAGIAAYRHAQCTREDGRRLLAAVSAERGAELNLSCYFNDVRASTRPAPDTNITVDLLRAALADTRVGHDAGTESDDLTFFLRVRSLGSDEVELHLRADTARLPANQPAEMLRAIESLLVAAVETHEDTALGELLATSCGAIAIGA